MRAWVLAFSLFAVSAFGREVTAYSKSHQMKIAPSLRTPVKNAAPKHKVVQAPRGHHRG